MSKATESFFESLRSAGDIEDAVRAIAPLVSKKALSLAIACVCESDGTQSNQWIKQALSSLKKRTSKKDADLILLGGCLRDAQAILRHHNDYPSSGRYHARHAARAKRVSDALQSLGFNDFGI